MSFNQVTLMGNMTRDPEGKFATSGMAISSFTIAVNRKWKDKEEVSFIDCTAFGKTAELIQKFFTKGKPILVSGRLKQDTWEDRNTGQKRSKLGVIVETMTFVGGNGQQQATDNRKDEPW